jgi:hypothetical protein
MKEVYKQDTPFQRFQEHPFIFAVLWILGLGHEKTKERIGSLMTFGSLRRSFETYRVSRKDSFLQLNSVETINHRNSVETINRIKKVSRCSTNRTLKIALESPMNLNDSCSSYVEAELTPPDCSYTQSPSWGFYVRMTPPDQEKFVRLEYDQGS